MEINIIEYNLEPLHVKNVFNFYQKKYIQILWLCVAGL